MTKHGFSRLMTMSERRPLGRRFASIRWWTLLGLLLIAVSFLGIGPRSKAQEGPKETFQIKALAQAMGPGTIMDPAIGAVRLNRSRNEIWGTVHVKGLPANSAFTLWAAVFNRPEGCITNVIGPVHCSSMDFPFMPNPARSSAFNIGAFVTGVDGTANASFRIGSGVPPEGAFVLWGSADSGALNVNGVRPGFDAGNGFGAEVHIVIRTHGMINAPVIADQLSKLNGGCPPNACGNVKVAPFESVTP